MTLTAVESIKGRKGEHPMVRCRCDCGEERLVRATKLRLGIVTSCGTCSRKDAARRGGLTRAFPPREKALSEALSQYRNNAKRRGLEFDLGPQEVGALLWSDCHYCGTAPAPVNGIDRVSNSEGYVASNVVACCPFCNYAKRDHDLSVFLDWAKRLHEHQSLLQRNRSALLRVVEQPDGRGADFPGGDK